MSNQSTATPSPASIAEAELDTPADATVVDPKVAAKAAAAERATARAKEQAEKAAAKTAVKPPKRKLTKAEQRDAIKRAKAIMADYDLTRSNLYDLLAFDAGMGRGVRGPRKPAE